MKCVSLIPLVLADVLTDTFIPIDRAPQSIVQRRPRAKPKFGKGPAGIELSPGLSVGFARLPLDFTFISCQAGNGLHQVTDFYFLAAPKVYRRRAIVGRSGPNDSLGAILNVQELARYFA